MNTIVSAYGPFVMKVFEPLRTYSSPSRRAVASIDPNASEPEFGSVIAHAPILRRVTMSGTKRSFCAMVPFDMIAAEVRPTDTPIAVTMPGHHRHSSMMGISVKLGSLPVVSSSARVSFSPRFSASMRLRIDASAIAPMPNVS